VKRVGSLLDHVQRGGPRRFQCFCDALIASGQRNVVDEHLKTCHTRSDVEDGPSWPLATPLSDRSRRKLASNWNELVDSLCSKMPSLLLNELEDRKVFTGLQIKKLKVFLFSSSTYNHSRDL